MWWEVSLVVVLLLLAKIQLWPNWIWDPVNKSKVWGLEFEGDGLISSYWLTSNAMVVLIKNWLMTCCHTLLFCCHAHLNAVLVLGMPIWLSVNLAVRFSEIGSWLNFLSLNWELLSDDGYHPPSYSCWCLLCKKAPWLGDLWRWIAKQLESKSLSKSHDKFYVIYELNLFIQWWFK
jgi:hypothetical protein